MYPGEILSRLVEGDTKELGEWLITCPHKVFHIWKQPGYGWVVDYFNPDFVKPRSK